MNKIFSWITQHASQTKQFAKQFAYILQPGDVLALEGDLGAGKTTFAKGLAKGLEIEEPIDSPTFTIVKEYQGSKMPFYHIDAYRIEAADEQLGLEEYLYAGGICLVEWASHIQEWLPEKTIQIEITVLADHSRKIRLTSSLPHVVNWCKDGWNS